MTRLITFIVVFSAILLVALRGAAAGQYAGAWTSDGGANSGKITINLNSSGEGDVSFSYQDQVFKAKKITAKFDGDKVQFIFEIELEGFKLKTLYTGTVDGKNMSGKYQTTNAEDGSALDTGTWKVTQQ